MSECREDSIQLFQPELILLSELVKLDPFIRYRDSNMGNNEDNLEIYHLYNNINSILVTRAEFGWNDNNKIEFDKITFYIDFLTFGKIEWSYSLQEEYRGKDLNIKEICPLIINWLNKLYIPNYDKIKDKIKSKLKIEDEQIDKIIKILLYIYKDYEYIDDLLIYSLEIIKDKENKNYLKSKYLKVFINYDIINNEYLTINSELYESSIIKNIFKESIELEDCIMFSNGKKYKEIL